MAYSRLAPSGGVRLLVVALLSVACWSHTASAQTYAGLGQALAGIPDFSAFNQIAVATGVTADKWWTAGSYEGVVYVPTNAAVAKFVAAKKTTLPAWLAANKEAAIRTLLQHVVSTAIYTSPKELYNGQRQASLLTLLTRRNRLTVSVAATGNFIASEVNKAKIGTKLFKAGSHSRITLVPIDTVLEPAAKSQDLPAPTYRSAWDVISQHPGLEDYYALALRAVTIDPNLKTQLSNTNGVFTVFAGNGEGMAALVKLLGKSAQDIIKDAVLCDKIVRYHITPGTAYTAAALVNNRKLNTLAPGHILQMSFYNGHTVVVGDRDAVTRNRGKFWNAYPRPFGTIMPGVKGGSWDLPVGKSMFHFIDAFLVPKA